MSLYKFKISDRDKASARFLAGVSRALEEAFAYKSESDGVTQSGVARKMERDKSAISRLLTSGGNPTVRTIAELAWAMGMEPELVLRDRESGQERGRNHRVTFTSGSNHLALPAPTPEVKIFTPARSETNARAPTANSRARSINASGHAEATNA